MNKIFLPALCLLLMLACTKEIEPSATKEKTSTAAAPIIWPCWNNIWQNRGQVPFDFSNRDIAFGIDNIGYTLRWEQSLQTYRLWDYNISNGTWTQRGLFPGTARIDGTVVVVGSKAYFGLGLDFDYVTPVYYHDWWEYNPATDQWTQKANFPAAARTSATAFAASSKAYIVGGYDKEFTNTYLKQTWQYDPALDTWEQKANFPGAGRDEAAGFGIGNKGYVGTGRGKIMVLNNPVTIYFKDFYEYNAQTNTWSQKADYPNATRFRAFAFIIRENGFIGGGYNASAGYRDLYMFNQVTNQWIKKTDYPGYGVSAHHFGDRIHFSTLDHGYVVEQDHLDRNGDVPRNIWRYVKKQNCPN